MTDTSDVVSNADVIFKGMVLKDRQTCTRLIQDYALSQGKRAVVDKSVSGGKNILYRCSSPTPCSFRVYVLRSMKKNTGGYVVSSLNLEHHGCTGRARPTARQVSATVAAQAAVRANTSIPAKQVRDQVKATTAMEVPLRMMYRARDEIIFATSSEYAQGFRWLPSLLDAFQLKNPECHATVEANEQGQFRRAFMSHPFVRRHQLHGQGILGLDGTFMKHAVYREIMLVLVGRTGNNSNIVLALAVCDGESRENCVWFLRQCKTAGVSFENVPVFSDRGSGLLAGLAECCPEAVSRFCTRHLIGNVKHQFAGNYPPDLESLMYRIQAARSIEEYEGVLRTLTITHPAISDYVKAIPPGKWTNIVQGVKLYGWRSTNFVESTNGAAIPARFKFPFELFSHFMEKFMSDAYECEKLGSKWKEEGRTVTPYAHKMIEEQRDLMGFYDFLPSSTAGVAFVRDTRYVRAKNKVNLAEKSCTCSFMFQYGLPCSHYLKALDGFKRMDELYDACDHCYKVDAFLQGYGCAAGAIELVLESELEERPLLPPPKTLTGAGRKRTKRIPSQGETANRTSKQSRHCSNCGSVGHNRRTCSDV